MILQDDACRFSKTWEFWLVYYIGLTGVTKLALEVASQLVIRASCYRTLCP